MPVLVRLRYCVIAMYFRDHNPPHFHIVTPESEAQMTIASLSILEGAVDRRAEREAREWASANRATLEAKWREFNP